jgi:hypothetical protein
MTIKKFSSFVLERYNASDLVGEKDSDDEVKDYKPRSKGEVDFKDLHKKVKVKHPVASEKQHTAEENEIEEAEKKLFPGTPEYKAKFGTDKEKHELKYGKSDVKKLKPYGYRDDPEDSPVSSQGKGRGRPKKIKEEVEDLKELSKDTLKSYTDKASSGKDVHNNPKKNWLNRISGLGRASEKLKKEEVDLEEDVFTDLKKIVEKKQTMPVKFANGKMEQVDFQSANAVLSLYKKVNEQNKLKIERMVNSSPVNFMKVFELAIGDVK